MVSVRKNGERERKRLGIEKRKTKWAHVCLNKNITGGARANCLPAEPPHCQQPLGSFVGL